MAFAWISEYNFETGDSTGWDSSSDTTGKLTFPHFSELARFPWPSAAPYRGAYCLRATVGGDTLDSHYLEADINVAAAGTAYVRFMVWFSPNFTASADDTFNLFEAWGSGTCEAAVGARVVAATNVINIGIGEDAISSWSAEEIERGKWYAVELKLLCDSGAGNDGTIDLWLTREGDRPQATVAATQVASLDQGAITDGVLGVHNQLSTTSGVILFDELIVDDARVYPEMERFPRELMLTKTGHAFVGRGVLDQISLLAGGAADCVLTIYDTDDANKAGNAPAKVSLRNTGANYETLHWDVGEVDFTRGAYLTLEGTAPRAMVRIKRAAAYGSTSAIREYGLTRKKV